MLTASKDFNGDPEMNKLGLDGLRSKESKQALRDYAKKTKTLSEAIELKETEYAQAKKDGNAARIKELDDELDTLKREEADHVASNPVAFKGTESAKKPTTKKRGRGKQESDDEDVKPAKKSRGKAKKEDSDNEDVKPANKSRGKAKKEESDDEDVKPAKKSRRKVKREESDDEEVVPTKTSRGKVKKEESDGDKAPLVEKTPGKARKAGGNVIKDEDELDSVPASPKRVAKGSKAIKKEERNDGELVLKQEDADEPGALLHTKQPAARGKKAIKEEDTEAYVTYATYSVCIILTFKVDSVPKQSLSQPAERDQRRLLILSKPLRTKVLLWTQRPLALPPPLNLPKPQSKTIQTSLALLLTLKTTKTITKISHTPALISGASVRTSSLNT